MVICPVPGCRSSQLCDGALARAMLALCVAHPHALQGPWQLPLPRPIGPPCLLAPCAHMKATIGNLHAVRAASMPSKRSRSKPNSMQQR